MNHSISRQVWVALLVLLSSLFAAGLIASDPAAHDDGRRKCEPAAPISATLVLLPIRAYQQTTSYTCGPASILTLLRHYKRDGDEMRIAREAKCTAEKGTSPQNMAAWLEAHGFDVNLGEGGTLRLLRDNLARGVPTLVEWIDWGGHWVVVVGYDARDPDIPGDDLILFADPADTHDGVKDGLTEFNAARFQAMWFDAFLFE
ncbi:MAG TPA: C39 family peptidase, partial [Pirellulales bacterium]|nr:C39 family peptidase [Pirellulales bacterium]